jgi:hypothetical protein
VIGALAADQPGARSLAAHAVERHRDLERGVDRLGARVGEEGMIESARGDLHQLVRELERGRMRHLEGGCEVECLELARNCLSDLTTAVSGVHAPQPRNGVEDLPALRRPVVHAARPREQPWCRLELAVGGERKPERLEV